MITQKSDFIAEYQISTSNNDKLDDYIAKYEEYYLLRLLGADLYALFKADLTGTPSVPQDARFLAIFNAFQIDDNGTIRISEGMKAMLVQFIYYHYITESSHFNTNAGQVMNNVEVSTNTPYNGFNLIEAYNEGVKNYQEIQWYIRDNDATYPEENMQWLDYSSGI